MTAPKRIISHIIHNVYNLINLIYYVLNRLKIKYTSQPRYDIKISNNIFDRRTKYIISYMHLFRYNISSEVYNLNVRSVYNPIDDMKSRINLYNLDMLKNRELIWAI